MKIVSRVVAAFIESTFVACAIASPMQLKFKSHFKRQMIRWQSLPAKPRQVIVVIRLAGHDAVFAISLSQKCADALAVSFMSDAFKVVRLHELKIVGVERVIYGVQAE